VAGAVVYWRATERQRARQAAAIDDAVVGGREAAQRLLDDEDGAVRPFDQR
jgi:hypothetical protein